MKRSVIIGALAGAALVLVGNGCGGSEEPVAVQSHAAPAEAALTIQHVQKGCHVWSDGRRQQVAMRLRVAEGGTVMLSNNDVDAHRLVQVAGPPVAIGSVMMMGGRMAVVFPEPGVYLLRTETVEVKGMSSMMETETDGPDNELQLEVVVT